jgi:hypothetical protein
MLFSSWFGSSFFSVLFVACSRLFVFMFVCVFAPDRGQREALSFRPHLSHSTSFACLHLQPSCFFACDGWSNNSTIIPCDNKEWSCILFASYERK